MPVWLEYTLYALLDAVILFSFLLIIFKWLDGPTEY